MLLVIWLPPIMVNLAAGDAASTSAAHHWWITVVEVLDALASVGMLAVVAPLVSYRRRDALLLFVPLIGWSVTWLFGRDSSSCTGASRRDRPMSAGKRPGARRRGPSADACLTGLAADERGHLDQRARIVAQVSTSRHVQDGIGRLRRGVRAVLSCDRDGPRARTALSRGRRRRSAATT
jgi:hypothetical protein